LLRGLRGTPPVLPAESGSPILTGQLGTARLDEGGP
jgi:hypothetical protein